MVKLIEDEENEDNDIIFQHKAKLVQFVQKMLFRMLELSVEEICYVREPIKSSPMKGGSRVRNLNVDMSYNPLLVCKFCDNLYPYAVFQLSNVGLREHPSAKKYFECSHAPS